MASYTGIEFNDEDIWYACASAVSSCIEYWGITPQRMADLVSQYELASFIEKNIEYLNVYGIKGVVNDIRDYIVECGGEGFPDVE